MYAVFPLAEVVNLEHFEVIIVSKLEKKIGYNTESKKRTETILVKVSLTEHEQIKNRAVEAGFGGKVSPYIRSQALRPCAVPSEGRLRQKIATMLCMHAQLTEATEDPELRQKYAEWEGLVWQSIRS